MKCEGFGGKCEANDAVRYRMMTQYENEESNFMTLCPACQKESDDHWEEKRKEYYGMVGK